MGSRNLDRIPMADWRAKAETIAEMWREGWRHVWARCETCRAEFHVDLERVLREKGPTTSLWNRKQGCPKDGCPGPVHFMVRLPGLHFYQEMAAPDPSAATQRRTLAEWAEHNRERDGDD